MILDLLGLTPQWILAEESGGSSGGLGSTLDSMAAGFQAKGTFSGAVSSGIKGGIGSGSFIEFDSMLEIEISGEHAVSDEAVEMGSFISYNKQVSPREIRVVLGIGGLQVAGQYNRTQEAAITAIEEMAESTSLLTLTTPTATYKHLNLKNYSYTRTGEKGANLLQVELKLQEIREVEVQSSQTTQAKAVTASGAKNKSDVSSSNQGKKQPKAKSSWLRDLHGSRMF